MAPDAERAMIASTVALVALIGENSVKPANSMVSQPRVRLLEQQHARLGDGRNRAKGAELEVALNVVLRRQGLDGREHQLALHARLVWRARR
jgi:hypothetical protein